MSTQFTPDGAPEESKVLIATRADGMLVIIAQKGQMISNSVIKEGVQSSPLHALHETREKADACLADFRRRSQEEGLQIRYFGPPLQG